MAVTTYIGRSRRALLHYNDSVSNLLAYGTYWMAIGRTTPWPVELAPPSPSVSATAIEEPIVYVRAEAVSLCRPVNSNPDVTVRGQGYRYVAPAEGLTQLARFIYIRGRFDPSNGQPYGTFRQLAVYSKLVPINAQLTATWLAPASVQSAGYCEYLENNAPTLMTLGRQEVIQVIIEFR